MLPVLSNAELELLAEDIRVNGLHDPIRVWIDRDNKAWLLDGRNRREACRLARIKPEVVVATIAEIPHPEAYVLCKNVLRREVAGGP